MANREIEKFERFLSDSFKEVLSRELRLSEEELEYLRSRYPKASIERLPMEDLPDGKSWYLVSF